jgi:Domain of unknown function (DUF5753)
MSQDDLGRTISYSGALVGRVEMAERMPSQDFADRCDEALNAGGFFSRFRNLVKRQVFQTWFEPFIEYEQKASKICNWDNRIVPGLLQTEDHARVVMRAGRPRMHRESSSVMWPPEWTGRRSWPARVRRWRGACLTRQSGPRAPNSPKTRAPAGIPRHMHPAAPVPRAIVPSCRSCSLDLGATATGGPAAVAWIAPQPPRQLRAQLRHRASLVRLGIQLRNRIHAVAADFGYDRADSYWTGPGRGWLAELDLPAVSREIVTDCLASGGRDIGHDHATYPARKIPKNSHASPATVRQVTGSNHYALLTTPHGCPSPYGVPTLGSELSAAAVCCAQLLER